MFQPSAKSILCCCLDIDLKEGSVMRKKCRFCVFPVVKPFYHSSSWDTDKGSADEFHNGETFSSEVCL